MDWILQSVIHVIDLEYKMHTHNIVELGMNVPIRMTKMIHVAPYGALVRSIVHEG